ncbi:hypothetical protein DIPPA_19776 [Diplonema papillatum]|nr:hypothetical protein DIPPA_19776 [Diplonema papillatum]|eukprot:gene2346-3639_t
MMMAVLICRSVVWVLVTAMTIAALAAPSSVAGSCGYGFLEGISVGMFKTSGEYLGGHQTVDTSDFYDRIGISKVHAYAPQGVALAALFLSLIAFVVYIVSFALSERCPVVGMRISMCCLDTLSFIFFLAAGAELIAVYKFVESDEFPDHTLSDVCDIGPGGPLLIVCSVMTIIALCPTLCCVATTDTVGVTTASPAFTPQRTYDALN